jgi:hypothetical protein
MLWKIAAVSFCLVPCAYSQNEQACTEALKGQLRTYYHEATGDTLSSLTQSAACSASNTTFTGSVFTYGSVGYGDSSNKCKSGSNNSFENHAKEIAMSYLPPEALNVIQSACQLHGMWIGIRFLDPKQMEITAKFDSGGNVGDVRVSDFHIPGGVTCNRGISDLKVNALLNQVAKSTICTRKRDEIGGYFKVNAVDPATNPPRYQGTVSAYWYPAPEPAAGY